MNELEKAIAEVVEPQLDELISSSEQAEPHTFSDRHNNKMRRLIKRQKRPYFRIVTGAGARAACIVLLCILLGTAALSVEAVRKPIKGFIISIFDDRKEVSVKSEGDEKHFVEDIYVLAKLPSGYELSSSGGGADSSYAFHDYYNGDLRLFFGQYTKESYKDVSFDPADHMELFTDEDGTEYLIDHTAEGELCVLWDNGDYVLHLVGNLTKEEALELCKSAEIEKS